ncbi:unnamed protein product [Clonostachys rosea f. rosea IK726]|uniref:Uncharacterized protein n=1 Tax=Clonostachys rosea f. rosea IK726 TaxID=1349383 RepID=A0ACA9TZF1_BIOOC|nr:unnamed protein product [Clonostachys rosea f. rosea IK726]
MDRPVSSQSSLPIRPTPGHERVKSRLPSRCGQQPSGTNNGAAAGVPSQSSIELIHQSLSVICQWHPGQPAAGLTWTENAYLALTGIAASQLEVFFTGDAPQADETLSQFLADLDMDCDTESYETWRHIVTALWRAENVASQHGRSSHSIQLLLNATTLDTPPRDCMGAVCALGLLQSVAPHGPEVKWQYPLNPLFLLKYKYPAVEFDEIERAFDTNLDKKAFSQWEQRVSAIMECMGPLTSQPVLLQQAGGIVQSDATYADYLKEYANAICDLGESRFGSFTLTDAIHDATTRFTAAKAGDPPPGTPEDCLPRKTADEEKLIWELHCLIVKLVFRELSNANLAVKNSAFKAVVQVSGQMGGTILSPRKHFLVLIPMAGKDGCHVKIDNQEVSWNPSTGFLLDEHVPISADGLIGYIGIFVYKF